jgi:cytochrome c553
MRALKALTPTLVVAASLALPCAAVRAATGTTLAAAVTVTATATASTAAASARVGAGAGAGAADAQAMAQRVRACTACHGAQGRASRHGYQPRIAGKPAGYLADQLIAFRDGRRRHPAMQRLLEPLDDRYLREIAAHFAAIDLPYPPALAPTATVAELARGEALARHGDAARGIPACAACHGPGLLGAQPGVPGLLGLPRDYLNAQLGAWQTGQRRSADPDCMAQIARRLRPDDVAAVSSWLASLPVPPGARPLPAPPPAAPLACGSFQAAVGAGTWGTTAPGRSGDPDRASAAAAPPPARADLLARGEKLARAGNCVACHTAPGGAPLAGGRPIETPFGAVMSSNLTPDPVTGIGAWSERDFRRAMHEGRSRDGRLLSPAFPYTSFTRMAPADVDAIHAWLRSLPPVRQSVPEHQLRWPYGTQWALTLWRWLHFAPASQAEIARAGADRGRYLVEVVGHCDGCHAPRNALGAVRAEAGLAGGPVGAGRWHAPSLLTGGQAGVQDWSIDEIVALLRDGRSARGTALGPMATVVRHGTAHLDEPDLRAMAAHLKALPRAAAPRPAEAPRAEARPGTGAAAGARGPALYREHCADCHGADGAGSAGAWPALAGNRALSQPLPDNLIATVLDGGYAPVTAGNPRPHGMPPYGHLLDDGDLAALLSHLRATWGGGASAVTPQQVQRARR